MVVCIVVYVILILLFLVDKRSSLFQNLRQKEKRTIFLTLLFSNLLATLLLTGTGVPEKLVRNAYGEGSKTESYEVTVEGELESEKIDIEIGEREYSTSEIQTMFGEVIKDLEKTILGENESRDRVETKLNLVDSIEGYPVKIQWEWNDYDVLDLDGEIIRENTNEKGTMVELRARLSCGQEETLYVTTVKIYPETKTGKEKWMQALQDIVVKKEKETKDKDGFTLPDSVLGKKVIWNKKEDVTGYYMMGFGVLTCFLLVWKYRKDEKEQQKRAKEQMIRDYPDIINKFVLLLTTGMTVKAVWTKIVQGYEEKGQDEKRYAYEEMRITGNEMQSGVAEAEAYERFGKRCKIAIYIKFGALLSQNLRKGGKGLCELLKIESIQAFENRKSLARRTGEEAATKLLVPMFGMLAVVMIIVMIPAFLSIRL